MTAAKRLMAMILCLLIIIVPIYGVQATEEPQAPVIDVAEATPTPSVEVPASTIQPEEPTETPIVELPAPPPTIEKQMTMQANASIASTHTTNRGETLKLQASYNEENAVWSVDDTTILHISKTSSTAIIFGSYINVTYSADIVGTKTGTATVKLISAGGSTIASFSVTVSSPITGFALSKTETYLSIGNGDDITLTITPADADILGVVWSSSNTEVAEVDQSGHITAKSIGNATITVTSDDGIHSAQLTVHVVQPTSSIDVSNADIQLTSRSQAASINATVYPLDATNRDITFQSSDTGIITVNASGTLTACGNGNAIITIRSVDGFSTAQANVNVSGLAEDISVDKSSVEFSRPEQTEKVTAVISPDNALVKDIIWSSDNNSIATVDSNGQITAVAIGSTVIHARAVDGGMQKDIQVKVLPRLTLSLLKVISYSYNSVTSEMLFPNVDLAYGEEYSLPTPDLHGYSFINWYKSFNNGVYSNPIYDKYINSSSHDYSMWVSLYGKFEPIHVTGVAFDKFFLSSNPGEQKVDAYAFRYPEKVADGRYTITSSDWSVLRPTDSGILNNMGNNLSGTLDVVGTGTATVTFQTIDGGYTASKDITIDWDPLAKIYYHLNPLIPKFDSCTYVNGAIKLEYPNYAGADSYFIDISNSNGSSWGAYVTPSSGSYVDTAYNFIQPGVTYTYRLKVRFNATHYTKLGEPISVLIPYPTLPPIITPLPENTTPPPSFTPQPEYPIPPPSNTPQPEYPIPPPSYTPPLDNTTPPPSYTPPLNNTTPPPSYTPPPVITMPPAPTLVPTATPTPLPQDILISHTSITIGVGQGVSSLSATVLPAGVNTSVTWSSMNTNVAAVSSTGHVTGIGVGSTIIRASTVNGLFKDCIVGVTKAGKGVIGISMSKSSAAIDEGKSLRLTARLTPGSPTNRTIAWSSNNPSVALVNGKGIVFGDEPGTAVITATASSGVTAQCTVTVRSLAASQVILNKTILVVDERKGASLKATVLPKNARFKTVTWASSDTSVATVSASGKITTFKAGTAQITATAPNGVSTSCTLVVRSLAVSTIAINRSAYTIRPGRYITLKVTLLPKNTPYKTVTWSSSDPSIATVSSTGKVVGVKPGTVTITATAHNGISVTSTITVQ